MTIYLWTEDSKSGFEFWKLISDTLYDGKIIVESKGSSGELLTAVSKLSKVLKELEELKKSTSDLYLLAFDESFDNTELHSTIRRIKNISKEHKNTIKILKMYCFEYVLLTFSNLGAWVFKNNSSILNNPKSLTDRNRMLDAKDELLSVTQNKSSVRYKSLDIIKDYYRDYINGKNGIESLNIEQFSAKLLHQIVRNTGFEITKNTVGFCWKTDCPDETQFDNSNQTYCSMHVLECKFYGSNYTVYDKLEELFRNSDLKRILNIDELKPYMVTPYDLNANYVLHRIKEEDTQNAKGLSN